MANTSYPRALQAFGAGEVNWGSDDIRCILIDTADYTYSSAHDFLNDVGGSARVATSGSLTSKTNVNGLLDAADVTFTSVTGDVSEAVIVYKHTGNEATSLLLLYLDTGVTGLPVTPNGDDMTLRWNASGIKQI